VHGRLDCIGFSRMAGVASVASCQSMISGGNLVPIWDAPPKRASTAIASTLGYAPDGSIEGPDTGIAHIIAIGARHAIGAR